LKTLVPKSNFESYFVKIMEPQKDKKVTFTFESGTTRAEIVQYVNSIKDKLSGGKFSEEDIEKTVQSLLSSTVRTMCDSCNKEITEEDKKDCTYTCGRCTLKYDLCEGCRVPNPIRCPFGFGCFKDEEDEKIFVPKKIYNPFEKYRGQPLEYGLTDRAEGTLLSEIIQCARAPFGILSVSEKNVSPKFFEEMWRYFRNTNLDCLLKHKKVERSKICDPEFPNWQIYQAYIHLLPFFRSFICKEPKFLKITYPNEDFFVISMDMDNEHRVDTFLPFFIPMSEYFQSDFFKEYKGYDVEMFREAIDRDVKNVGQILLCEFLF
jgi:hypothetical protein